MGLSPEEKERFLKALEEDWEFRYAVMGLLGIQELVKAVAALTNEVAGLKERVGKLEDRVGGLENRVGSLENRVGGLESKVDGLIKGMEELRAGLNALAKDVRDIKVTLENVTTSIEVEANNLVQYYLRQRGINIVTSPIQLYSTYEFDIYGTNGQLTIVGEAKVRVGPAVIDHVVERVREAMKAFPSKFPGKVITVVYCLRALQDAVERARELGVWLIEDGNERTKFPG